MERLVTLEADITAGHLQDLASRALNRGVSVGGGRFATISLYEAEAEVVRVELEAAGHDVWEA